MPQTIWLFTNYLLGRLQCIVGHGTEEGTKYFFGKTYKMLAEFFQEVMQFGHVHLELETSQ